MKLDIQLKKERQMKTRIIHTKIWTDSWFRGLNRSSRDLFIYLLTNSHIGLTDIYEISDDVICFECQLTPKELTLGKEDLYDKVLFYNGWVKIVNLEKYQTFKGEKNEIAKKRERDVIPADVKDKLNRVSIGYSYPSDTTSNKKSIIRNKKSETNNKKSITESSRRYENIDDVKEEDIKEIADHYQVSLSFVKSKYEDMVLWHEENPRRNRKVNWRATLTNWVKRDAIKFLQEERKRGNNYVDARD